MRFNMRRVSLRLTLWDYPKPKTMKNLLSLLFLVSVCTVMQAQKIKPDEVPQAVKDQFSKEHPDLKKLNGKKRAPILKQKWM